MNIDFDKTERLIRKSKYKTNEGFFADNEPFSRVTWGKYKKEQKPIPDTKAIVIADKLEVIIDDLLIPEINMVYEKQGAYDKKTVKVNIIQDMIATIGSLQYQIDEIKKEIKKE
jgi:hypothetical protein